MREVQVLIDPGTFPDYARLLIAWAQRNWGVPTVCVHRQLHNLAKNAGDLGYLGSSAVLANYRVGPDADLRRVAEALAKRHQVIAVVPQTEELVLPACELGSALGVAWADPEVVRRFRDKFALKQHLAAAPDGPRINAIAQVKDLVGIREAATSDPRFDRFVLKPNDGAGNRNIGYFEVRTSDQDLQAYLDSIHGQGVSTLLMEQLLVGEEYCVNGQVDGAGKATTYSVFRTVYMPSNGKLNLAGSFRLVPFRDAAFGAVDQYAKDVLRTAGLVRSPFHMELMVDDEGPCLIEVAARLAGAGMPYDTSYAHGGAVDLFELASQHYLGRPAVRAQEPDWGAYDSGALRTICGVATTTGRIFSLHGVGLVEAMPESVHWIVKPSLGGGLTPTRDIVTIPWQITVAGQSESQLDAAEERIRRTITWNEPSSTVRSWADRGLAGLAWSRRRLRAARILASVRTTRLALDGVPEQAGPDPILAAGGHEGRASAQKRLYVPGMPSVKQVIERVAFSGPGLRAAHRTPGVMEMARNFAGGDDAAGALATASDLAASSLLCSLHLREPPVADVAGVTSQLETYRSLIGSVEELGLVAGAEVSVKLEQLGLHTPGGLATAIEHLHDLATRAASVGLPMTVDMEWPEEVDDTLRAWREVHEVVPSLGIVLQSYLPRTEKDCRGLTGAGTRVRLCKGGYRARRGISYASGHEVDLSYVRCLRTLFGGAGYPMVATHDSRLIDIARDLASASGRTTADYELQMMLGVRSSEQVRLARSGQQVRVYVIFGSDWYSWFVGRLAERPANVVTMIRSVAEHAR